MPELPGKGDVNPGDVNLSKILFNQDRNYHPAAWNISDV